MQAISPGRTWSTCLEEMGTGRLLAQKNLRTVDGIVNQNGALLSEESHGWGVC